jgi:RNA polymerase sigma-70 factor, ECF subfamily
MTDWPAIVRQYGPLVWQTAYRLLANDADAADCYQETFISALEFVRRGRVVNWPAFLQRLATTRAVDLLRRRARERRRSEAPAEWDLVPSSLSGPVERVEAAELAGRLREALAQLPERQAEVFCLRCVNELSYEEIAAELAISVNAVGVSLYRARARLSELLAGASPENCGLRNDHDA